VTETGSGVMECIRGRRSVRRFRRDPPQPTEIRTLLDAARWAPSNHNRQAWRFIVVQNPSVINRMCDTVEKRLEALLSASEDILREHRVHLRENFTLFKNAPVVIVALHRRPTAVSQAFLKGVERGEMVSGELISSAMAVQNMLLAAHAIGLGTCVLTGPLVAADEIENLLRIPSAYQMTCLVAVGYANETPAPPPRKRIEQIAEFIGQGK